MNYELLSKLAMEETEKLKTEVSFLRKRNEILHTEVDRLQALIKKLEEEKTNLKEEVSSLKGVLEFKKDENHHFSHYS